MKTPADPNGEKQMDSLLRVLIVEDSPDDAELLIRELRRGGFEVFAECVDCAADMAAALDTGTWDVVISDYMMPSFSGMNALKLLHDKALDLPFIIVSGKMDDITAVNSMRAGAHDYFLKDNLARLTPAIRREMAEARLRAQYRHGVEKLKESERRFRETLENIRMAAIGLDMEGKVTFCNDFLLDLLGCTREEIIDCDWFGTFLPEESNAKDIYFESIAHGTIPSHFEHEVIIHNGEKRLIEWNNTLLRDVAGTPQGLISIGEDCTERKRAEKALRDQLHFIQVLIDTIPTPIFYKDTQGRYLGCNAAFEKLIGLSRESITGKTIYNIVPEDLAAIYNKGDLALLTGKGTQIYESSVACADGTQQDVIFYNAVFMNSDNTVGGLVGAILDISERKQTEIKLRYMSTHDMLTGLYNRAYFDEELERLKDGRKFPVSIVMADVDRLKEVNDNMGHATGDEMLKRAAQVLKTVFRKEDVVARVGGDEFAALLPDTDENSVREAIERLQSCIKEFNIAYGTLPLNMSMGSATARKGEQLMSAWRKADELMYEEKKSRGSRGS
jgi:diguanylate cyclase (GGDEF)-like protein/PAS domain S-box-containing protein